MLTSLILFWMSSAYAQDNEIVLDKVLVKVDNYIVLKSDLEKAYLQNLAANSYTNDTRCDVLRQLVIAKMMLAQAEIDSVTVDASEVSKNLDHRMKFIIQQFGGEEEIENSYGKSINQIKTELYDDIEEQLIINKMQSSIFENIKISPKEVKDFFKSIPKDSLPYISKEVIVGQIIKTSDPGKKQLTLTKNNLQKIREQIVKGQYTFEELAIEYSRDPGSAQKGGRLPKYSRGDLAPEFEEAVFQMEKGELSQPVKTKFGYHLIQLIDRQGTNFESKHILLIPQPDAQDHQNSYDFLDSLRDKILNKEISFERMAREHSDDRITSTNSGYFSNDLGSSRVSVEELDPNIFFMIDTMTLGNISKPLEYMTESGEKAHRIIYFKNKRLPHQANFQDDYQKLAQAALNKKKQIKIDDWFEKLKKNIFIELTPEYKECDLLK